MIKSVTVTNYLGESIEIELRFPEKSGFLIQNIDGLGPSKATVNSTELSTSDGSSFNSARVNSRNIVLTLKLLDNPTIETSRQKTYKYFPIKKQIKLTIETDNRTCEIYGYVESNEPTIFSQQETTQISIICPDPYFYSSVIASTVFSGIDPLFEFPFSNESLNSNLIEMGQIIINQEKDIYYTGDSDIGVIIRIHAIGMATNLTIYNSGTHEVMKINTDELGTIIDGDDVIISTVKGNKYAQILRAGEYYNVLRCLEKNTDWFQLTKGDNIFVFAAESGITNLQFKIENRIIYEGI